MKIDNGSDPTRPCVYLFDIDVEQSKVPPLKESCREDEEEEFVPMKQLRIAPEPEERYERPPSPPPYSDYPKYPKYEYVEEPKRKKKEKEKEKEKEKPKKPPRQYVHYAAPVPVRAVVERTIPETREEAVLCDLVLLVDAPYHFTWTTLAQMGVTAEDVLFTKRWQCDLVPTITSRLKLTWRELRHAGLNAEMVAQHGRPLDFWIFTFNIDIMFFQTMLFLEADFRRLKWTQAQVRANLGYDVYVNESRRIELREPRIKTLIYE